MKNEIQTKLFWLLILIKERNIVSMKGFLFPEGHKKSLIADKYKILFITNVNAE